MCHLESSIVFNVKKFTNYIIFGYITHGKIDLSSLTPFDPVNDPSSLSQRWKTWKRRFKIYVTALNITDATQKRAGTIVSSRASYARDL